MSLRGFLLPWDTQPQDAGDAVFGEWAPDWCWHAPLGSVLVPGSRQSATLTQYSGQRGANRSGQVLTHNGSSHYENWQTPDWTSALPIVIGSVFEVTNTSTTYQTAVGLGGSVASSGLYAGVGQGGTATSIASWIRTGIGGSAPEVTGPTATIGQIYSIVRISRSETDHVMYVNGARYTVVANGGTPNGSYRNVSIGVVARDTTPVFYGAQSVGLGFVARTDPGDEWMRAFSIAPYETLFAPRRIMVPVSAGGAVSHDATGVLVAGAAVVAGTATDVATYTATGALSAAAAVVAGTATHLTLHTSTGALAAGAAVVVGAANHINVHGSTGALAAGAAVVAGTAEHTAPGSFTSTGALAAAAAVVAGTATHKTLHTSTGVLAAGAALVSGVAVHSGPGSVVDEPRRQAAGRASKRKRDKLVVAIDGQDVIVSSVEEAEELIDKVLEDAKATAELAQSRANASKRRPVSKVMYDARKTLALPEIEAPPELEAYADKVMADIRTMFTEQLRSIEITALLAKRQRQEEDDEDVLMLIA